LAKEGARLDVNPPLPDAQEYSVSSIFVLIFNTKYTTIKGVKENIKFLVQDVISEKVLVLNKIYF
jgi:hypothetical protein